MKLLQRVFCCLALCALVQAGCGKSLPPAADAVKAREALRVSLDAWKNGDNPESMSKRQPPIIVGDPEWKPEVKLVDYEIAGKETPSGGNLRCGVELTLEIQGRVVKKHA